MKLRAIGLAVVSTKAQVDGDKLSIPSQVEDIKRTVANNDWTLVELLTMPGQSRDYYNIYDLIEDAAANGYDQPRRLLQYIETRAFDVLIVRNTNRLGRDTVQAEIISRVIRQAGARILSLDEGMIDSDNYLSFMPMALFKTTNEVRALTSAKKRAMKDYARRGIPISSKVVMSHREIRNARGERIGMEPDPAMRPLFDAVALLLMEGVGYRNMERELYQRYGFASPNGKPYQMGRIHAVLNTPAFWGHIATNYRKKKGAWRSGEWIYEPGHDIPEGVEIYYNVHEPMWTGELADQLKAELRRRAVTVRGRGTARAIRRFSGLVICGECGYYAVTMNTHVQRIGKPYYCLRCMTKYNQTSTRGACSQSKTIGEKKIEAWFDERLRAAIALGAITPLVGDDKNNQTAARLEKARIELDAVEHQLRTLIRQQAAAPESAQPYYEDEIRIAASRLDMLKLSVQSLEREHLRKDTHRQQQAVEEIAGLIDKLWTLDDHTVNQLLHRAMGTRRLVILDGEILPGTVESPHRPGKPRR